MPECETCGRNSTQLLRAVIEGSYVNVCSNCSQHAEAVELKPIQKIVRIKQTITISEPSLNPDFAYIIKEAREKAKLTRKQLAEKIKEKESVIERIERGNTPEEKVARKLEKILKIKILDYKEANVRIQHPKQQDMTLGDVLEVKMKKR
jgi:putative transcription factor